MSDNENKDLQNQEKEVENETGFEIVREEILEVEEEIINVEEDALPSLNNEVSENPEEIRAHVQETIEEADGLISEELKEVSMEPIIPEVESEPEDETIKNIKRQNLILKIVCGCLIACTAVNVFLAIPKPHKSNMYVSNSEINKVIINDVDQGEIMSAAQVYNKNIDSMVAIHIKSVTPSIFGDYVSAGSGSGFVISEDG